MTRRPQGPAQAQDPAEHPSISCISGMDGGPRAIASYYVLYLHSTLHAYITYIFSSPPLYVLVRPPPPVTPRPLPPTTTRSPAVTPPAVAFRLSGAEPQQVSRPERQRRPSLVKHHPDPPPLPVVRGNHPNPAVERLPGELPRFDARPERVALGERGRGWRPGARAAPLGQRRLKVRLR
eukprot:scaffold32910_cov86-Isochrysis_galbana.AAC.2